MDESLQIEPDKIAIGALLQAERGRQKLSLKQVAQELNLSETMISALENDLEITEISPTYVRGYQRAYVRLLGIDETEILNDLSPVASLDKSQQDLHYFDKNIDLSNNKRGLSMLPKIAAAIVLCAIAFFSWPKLASFLNFNDNNQTSQNVSQTDIKVFQGGSDSEQNTTTINNNADTQISDESTVTNVSSENQSADQVSAEQVESVDTNNRTITTQVINLANDLNQSEQLDSNTSENQVNASIADDKIENKITELLQPQEQSSSDDGLTDEDQLSSIASVNQQDSSAKITFVSNGESWLSIADADDNNLYRNTLKLDRVTVTGNLPFYVSTGNVSVLRVLADQGEQQKIGIYNDSKTVAKFFIDLDAEGRLTFTPK